MQSYLGQYPGSRSGSDIKFLRAVQSFIDQEDKDSELIIVSDGCEITHKLYYEHFKNEERIKYVYVDKDTPNMYEGEHKYYRGLPRQVGRSLVTGEVTTYMDSDDFLMPFATDKLKKIWINVYDSIDVITNISWYDNIIALEYGLRFDLIGEPNKLKIKGLEGTWYTVKITPKNNGEITIVRCPWLTSHKSEVKTKWRDIDTSKGVNISEDTDFSIRIFKENRGSYISIPLYVRCHVNNMWDL